MANDNLIFKQGTLAEFSAAREDNKISNGTVCFVGYTETGDDKTTGTIYLKSSNGLVGLMPHPGTSSTIKLPLVSQGVNKSPKYEVLSISGGGIGTNALQSNRILYVNTGEEFLRGSNHYISQDKIGINSTSAPTENFYVNGNTQIDGCIKSKNAIPGGAYYQGRDTAFIQVNNAKTDNTYLPALSFKTKLGSWDFGNNRNANERLQFVYINNTDYENKNNEGSMTRVYFTETGEIHGKSFYATNTTAENPIVTSSSFGYNKNSNNKIAKTLKYSPIYTPGKLYFKFPLASTMISIELKGLGYNGKDILHSIYEFYIYKHEIHDWCPHNKAARCFGINTGIMYFNVVNPDDPSAEKYFEAWLDFPTDNKTVDLTIYTGANSTVEPEIQTNITSLPAWATALGIPEENENSYTSKHYKLTPRLHTNVDHGGTGATSFTTNTILTYNGTKLISTKNYVANSKLAIGSTSEPTENFYVNGTSKFTGAVTMSSTATIAGITKITNTTDTTATTNGALVVTGGVGISGSLRVYKAAYFGNNVSVTGVLSAGTSGTTATTNKLTIHGQSQFNGNAAITGILHIQNTTDSTVATNGALVVTGGVGIGKTLRVTGNTGIAGTLNVGSTSQFANIITLSNTDATKQKITTAAGAMYISSFSTLYLDSGASASLFFRPQGKEQACFNTSGQLQIKSTGDAKATIIGPKTAGTFYFPNTGGTFVTHVTRGTAVGSASLPVYIASTGQATACTASSIFSALSWTEGTTAGPVLNATVATQSKTAQIPSASTTASGVVTTGPQTFAGNKTFTGQIFSNNSAVEPQIGVKGYNGNIYFYSQAPGNTTKHAGIYHYRTATLQTSVLYVDENGSLVIGDDGKSTRINGSKILLPTSCYNDTGTFPSSPSEGQVFFKII